MATQDSLATPASRRRLRAPQVPSIQIASIPALRIRLPGPSKLPGSPVPPPSRSQVTRGLQISPYLGLRSLAQPAIPLPIRVPPGRIISNAVYQHRRTPSHVAPPNYPKLGRHICFARKRRQKRMVFAPR